ncbi:PQQ-binding-like beta-propeller repeat protein, partial [Verrucomicrobia bacterium]|nr:PQQ-binding-like beta-propeller repeat protein [Verrucomicrobiota bacterium]
GQTEIHLFTNADNPTTLVINPQTIDTDGDGLTDLAEVNVHKTNPALADTDGDGLSDGDEINKHKTNPLVADTDGDNYSDSEEIAAGTDPNDNKSYPIKIKPPVITVPPKSIYIKTNDDASFNIQATGTSISYQWFLDKKPIAGADSNTLIIPNVSKENVGNYTVEISNEAGTVSQDATLTLVEGPPVFISVPNRFDTVFEKGETMILAPKVKSVGPTTFQWFKEGNKLEGETKLILKVNDVDYDDADDYTLDATNLFGTEISETMRVSIVNEANIGQHIDDEFPKVQGVIDSSPAVGKDGSIYYSTSGEKGYLYRHKSNGERKWSVSFNSGLRGSPAIDENDVIYVLEDAGALHAVKNEESRGKKLWRYKLTGGDVDAEGEYREFGNSPAIAEDGTVIFGWFDRNVYAVKDGKLVWKFPTEGRIVASPSIALDGTIYIGDDEGNLYAIKADGTAVWPEPFDTKAQIMTRPAIDSEGNIYFGSFSGEFYALAPNGDLRWSFDTDQDIWTSAVIRADGTVYFGADDGYFYALNTETGKVKWTYRIKENWQRSSTAALGLDGSIYFTLWDNSFYSINRIGKKLWSIKLKGDGVDVATFSSPSLLDDGRIYVGIQDGNNSLINTIQGGSPIDSRSPWPSFGGDLQNTGRVVTSTSNKDSFRPELRLVNKETDNITMQVTGDAFEIYKLQYSSDLRSWKFESEQQSIQTNYRGKANFKTSIINNGTVFFRLISE